MQTVHRDRPRMIEVKNIALCHQGLLQYTSVGSPTLWLRLPKSTNKSDLVHRIFRGSLSGVYLEFRLTRMDVNASSELFPIRTLEEQQQQQSKPSAAMSDLSCVATAPTFVDSPRKVRA